MPFLSVSLGVGHFQHVLRKTFVHFDHGRSPILTRGVLQRLSIFTPFRDALFFFTCALLGATPRALFFCDKTATHKKNADFVVVWPFRGF